MARRGNKPTPHAKAVQDKNITHSGNGTQVLEDNKLS